MMANTAQIMLLHIHPSPLAFTIPLPLRTSLTTSTSVCAPISFHRLSLTASHSTRLPDNVPGPVFVDDTCINCDTCRWLSPSIFNSANSQSRVHTQPTTPQAHLSALQAALSCPTGSIHAPSHSGSRMRDAAETFPLPAVDAQGGIVPGIFYNGYASSQTFGCASWLLISKTITVMFDVPRFSEPLARSISRKINPEHPVYIVLSHRDDVFGHEAWARRLGATRVIHHAEVNKKQGTNEVELKLTDSDFPYSLSEDDDVQLLHVPGHTPGSVALLDRVSKSIFTGDHLFFSNSYGKLMGSPVYIWHSWRLQIESVRMLKNVDFLHAFPGHGRAFHFVDDQERRHGIEQAAEYMATLSSVRL